MSDIVLTVCLVVFLTKRISNFAPNKNHLMKYKFKAVLFDFDGVVVDTEDQYTVFWDEINRKYIPEVKGFAQMLKGNTLVEVFNRYFPNEEDRKNIRRELNEFQEKMTYPYVPGVEKFVDSLREAGVKTAVATSSNRDKMNIVYKARPEIQGLFDRIFTSEDCHESKPSPDCYITAARYFGFAPQECIVIEDSINGLKAGAASGAMVVGLSTTNSVEIVKAYSDIVIPNFEGFTPEDADKVFRDNFCGK